MKISNILWNFTGLAIPLLVAVFTVPVTIEIIGLERFGILALAWGLIGYAGVFDLGIGRATTQLISQMRGQSAYTNIPLVVSTAAFLTFKTGIIGFAVLALSGLAGIQNFINHSDGLEGELKVSVLILALAIPVQAISATYRGVNEAFENFRGISLLRMALGALNFLGPYLVSHYTVSLPWLVSTLLVSRLFALIVFRCLAMQCVLKNTCIQFLETNKEDEKHIKKRLFTFGGWFTISSVISPLLVQADRFVIACVISAAAVSAYTIPYEVVVQSLIIVGSVTSVAFPSLTKLIHEQPDAWKSVFNRWLKIIGLIMFVVTSGLGLLLPTILPIWIGAKLPGESILVGQILCIGVFANSFASLYYAAIHSIGYPAHTAKLHCIELPLYGILLYVCSKKFGLYGVAGAWTIRMLLDAVCMKFIFSRSLIK
jgi:O-antigen/teichoic acid export membrane protein